MRLAERQFYAPGCFGVDGVVSSWSEAATLDDLTVHVAALVSWTPKVLVVVNETQRSRGRDWHQDIHPSVADRKPPFEMTAFLALGDCAPGSIELIVGSHAWPVAEREEIRAACNADHRSRAAEDVLRPLVEAEIVAREAEPYRPELKRGDVLIWHPWLWHRSEPDVVRDALVVRYQWSNEPRTVKVE